MSMMSPESFVSDLEDAPFSELVPPHGEEGGEVTGDRFENEALEGPEGLHDDNDDDDDDDEVEEGAE